MTQFDEFQRATEMLAKIATDIEATEKSADDETVSQLINAHAKYFIAMKIDTLNKAVIQMATIHAEIMGMMEKLSEKIGVQSTDFESGLVERRTPVDK